MGARSAILRRVAVVMLPLIAVVGALAWWNPVGDFWGPVEPPKAQVEAYDSTKLASAKVLDPSIYDQTKLNRLVREPQNTVSNLAYVAVGLAIVFASRRALSKSLGTACVFLGVGSGLYHASLLPEWRMLDILGVYAVLFCLLALAGVAVFRGGSERPLVWSTWVVAFFAGIHRNDVRIAGLKVLDSTYVVVSCVVLGSLLALCAGHRIIDRKRYAVALALYAASAAVAFFGGIADRFDGQWAKPDAVVQGHAVWHTFGAIALLATYEIFAMTGYDRRVFCEAKD